MTGTRALHTGFNLTDLKSSKKNCRQFLTRLLAMVILLCFVVLAFSSVIIGIAHMGHDCLEKNCLPCAVVKVLKIIVFALIAMVSALVSVTFAAASDLRKSFFVNLVEFKTRMNN